MPTVCRNKKQKQNHYHRQLYHFQFQINYDSTREEGTGYIPSAKMLCMTQEIKMIWKRDKVAKNVTSCSFKKKKKSIYVS